VGSDGDDRLYEGQLADLCGAEWGYTWDYVWSEQPNVGVEQGITWPRLRSILRARRKRKEQELREMASVMACAFHDPSKLDSLFKPQIEETLDKARSNPDEWDYDEWWKRES
jgi:hypothetical protein